ncbi:hypothetical protein EST38_g12924 [Candolleomyces aberdarensis]|uniref:Uncharacterized protein n=1 Tax=Candolleomyces aberdarensis TaxID=2316362 RepID=A0A4V1Q1V7_9AGAR|nr:hypothetical protein EST38_g12924 [Candolleomyces aberdarensis]
MHFLALLALVATSLATFITATPVSSPLDGDVTVLNRDFVNSDNQDLERREPKVRAPSLKPATRVKAAPKALTKASLKAPAKVLAKARAKTPPPTQKKRTVKAPGRAPVKAPGKPTMGAAAKLLKKSARSASVNKAPAQKPAARPNSRNIAAKQAIKAPSQHLTKGPAVKRPATPAKRPATPAKRPATPAKATNTKKPVAPVKAGSQKPGSRKHSSTWSSKHQARRETAYRG